MAKRETFIMDLECPYCGRSGKAEWEENENPMHHKGKLDTKLQSVSEGFQVRGNSIICSNCDKIVESN